MDIAFCVNDGYAQYIGVSIKGLCENNAMHPLRMHVLTDGMGQRSIEALRQIVAPYPNASLEVHAVDDSRLRGLKDTWSIYTWYRVLLPSVLPVDVRRVLYLDADTVVCGDISRLFDIDMSGKAIGCAIDVETHHPETFERCAMDPAKKYVCAGIMLMNLDYWRQHDLARRIVRWGFDHNDTIKFPDQDTINVLCQDTKIILPMRYGVQNLFFTHPGFLTPEYKDQLIDALERPAIVHYAGCAPWVKEFDNMPLHHIWMRYTRTLDHPVLPRYQTTGLNRYKVMVYRLLHRRERRAPSLAELRDRVNAIQRPIGQDHPEIPRIS